MTSGKATTEFARRARERMARGEPLTVAIGGDEAVLAPALREAVLALLDEEEGLDTTPANLAQLPPEVTIGQAADLLGVSRALVVHLVERGELPARKVGSRRRLATADVLARREQVRNRREATLRDVVAASRDLDLYPPPVPVADESPPPPVPEGSSPPAARPSADERPPPTAPPPPPPPAPPTGASPDAGHQPGTADTGPAAPGPGPAAPPDRDEPSVWDTPAPSPSAAPWWGPPPGPGE
jgi:excisionase family DNA binding protein